MGLEGHADRHADGRQGGPFASAFRRREGNGQGGSTREGDQPARLDEEVGLSSLLTESYFPKSLTVLAAKRIDLVVYRGPCIAPVVAFPNGICFGNGTAGLLNTIFHLPASP